MTQLYAICDTGWNLIRTASTAIGLTASTGKTYSNAALAKIEDLRSNFVLPIDQGILPDQEWQTVVGNPAITLNGNPQAPDTMSASLSYQTQPIDLDTAKKRLRKRAQICKFERMDAGIEIELNTTKYVVQTDSESRSLLSTVYFKALSGALPAGANWRMKDNSYPHLTTGQIIELGDAVSTMIAQCYDQQAAHDAAIGALPDLAACQNYDCSAGYPDIVVTPES